MRKQTEGTRITIDWHDGPLCEITRLDFDDGEPLIELRSLGVVEGTYPREVLVSRLDRRTVQAMLDALDGKPVKDFDDEEIETAPRGEKAGPDETSKPGVTQ